MRVAYYGSKGKNRHGDYMAALKAWDSSEAWDNGGQIQIQSRSKRLLPETTTHTTLDEAQQAVVDELDTQVEDLRDRADTTAWRQFSTASTVPSAPRFTACFSGWTRSCTLQSRCVWFAGGGG